MSEETAEIRIRLLDQEDGEAVRRLAERDSAVVPTGQLLGASVDGELAVAVSLASGRQIADPFVRTSELRRLVAERAAQLNGGHRGVAKRVFGRRSRAALPGGGGRLLSLPHRADF